MMIEKYGIAYLVRRQLVTAPDTLAVLRICELGKPLLHADAHVVAHAGAAAERLGLVADLRA
jgi:hypothetical protein